ncbi:MAG: polyprenyl synthetase family protein [Chloroflexi bacterium]|nr:polyprenyl synthetase family protein [Chloroflexota bacterium]
MGLDPREASKIPAQVIGESLQDTGPGTAFRQELSRILRRRAEDRAGAPQIGQLPVLACAAVGGNPLAAGPLTAGWQLVRLAAKLLDDIEDREVETGAGILLNAATGLLFAAPLVLDELSAFLGRDVAHCVSLELQRAMLRAAAGQHADLSGARKETRTEDADTWLEIALAKSGELLGWAAWAGALVGGAGEQARECLREYGVHLGVLLQVADDFYGIWGPGGAGDLAGRQLNLAVCYARLVLDGAGGERVGELGDHPSPEGGEALGDHTGSPLRTGGGSPLRTGSGSPLQSAAADMEEVDQLTQLGAQAFLLATARVQHRQALAALERAGASLKDKEPLVMLLNRVMPVVGSPRI